MKKLLAGLFFLAITGILGWLVGKDLWADFQHRNAQYESVRDARITEAKCKSKLFVIAFCDIKATGTLLPGGSIELNYFILGGIGDEPIGLQRAKGPGAPTTRHVTTNYGMDHLVTRIVSFLVMLGFMIALAVGGLIGFMRRKNEAPAGQPVGN
jgi:hypothetical protein